MSNTVTLLLEGTQRNGVLYGTKEVLKLSREHNKENIWNINQHHKYPAKMEIMFLNAWVVIPVGGSHIRYSACVYSVIQTSRNI